MNVKGTLSLPFPYNPQLPQVYWKFKSLLILKIDYTLELICKQIYNLKQRDTSLAYYPGQRYVINPSKSPLFTSGTAPLQKDSPALISMIKEHFDTIIKITKQTSSSIISLEEMERLLK